MLRLIEAAASKPVTVEELKAHVKASDFDDDDDELEIFLDAAIEYVQRQTSRILQPTTWQVDRCGWWSGCLEIMLTPIRDISIGYLDAGGVLRVVDETHYRWERTDLGTGRITLLSAFTSPEVKADTYNAVQIAIDAGFDNPDVTGAGDDPELILPVRAKQAILMLAASWYKNREAVSENDLKKVPLAAEALMYQLKVYR